MTARKARRKTTRKSANKAAGKNGPRRKSRAAAVVAGPEAVSFQGNKITITDPAIIRKLKIFAKSKTGVPLSAIITLTKKKASRGRQKESGTDAVVDVRC